jgi:hypothetical protein
MRRVGDLAAADLLGVFALFEPDPGFILAGRRDRDRERLFLEAEAYSKTSQSSYPGWRWSSSKITPDGFKPSFEGATAELWR